MDELKYTEKQMQDRLASARSIARQQAWRDLLRRFTPAQRQRLANDMAHSFTITAIEVEDRYGHRPGRIVGGISLEEARKAIDEDREKERAARAATSGVMEARYQVVGTPHADDSSKDTPK